MSSYIPVMSGGVRWKVLPDFRLLFEFGAFADLTKTLARGSVVRDLRATRLIEVSIVDYVFFVKIYKPGGLWSRVRLLFGGSGARREMENCLGATRRGVQVVPLTAIGERGVESFVVTQKLDGWNTLEQVLLENRISGKQRRDIMFAFGVWARQIHDSGVWQQNVDPGNVLVKTWGEGFEFRLIDFEKMRLIKSISEQDRLTSVAKLNRFPKLTRADRVRFLDGYLHKYPDEVRSMKAINEKIVRMEQAQRERFTARLSFDCVEDNRTFGAFATEQHMGYFRRGGDLEGIGIDIEEAVRLSEGKADESRYKRVKCAQALYTWKQANLLVREGGAPPLAVIVANGVETGQVIYRAEQLVR